MPAILPGVRIICNSVRNVETCISCRRNCNRESIKVEIILVFQFNIVNEILYVTVNKCCSIAIDLVIKRMKRCK